MVTVMNRRTCFIYCGECIYWCTLWLKINIVFLFHRGWPWSCTCKMWRGSFYIWNYILQKLGETDVYLTSRWDNVRKQLIEAVLSCEGLPSPDICSICLEVCIRCIECPKQFMCHSCDENVHKFLPFHDRCLCKWLFSCYSPQLLELMEKIIAK